MNIHQSIIKKNTRTEILLSEIENMIINGSMMPGERLDETILAKKYGVSLVVDSAESFGAEYLKGRK